MQSIADITVLLTYLLLGGFAIVIFRGLITGRINLRGLVTSDGRRFSPARLPALILSVATGPLYLGSVVLDGTTAGLPSVPDSVLLILGGGSLVYLMTKGAGGVAARRFRSSQ